MPELRFPAIPGTMGDRTIYMTVMSLQMVSRFFSPTPADIPAEQRAQRALNERRVPEITQYILDKEDDWVFGSVTVSFDGESSFEPSKNDEQIGDLLLDPDTEFVIVDGQHRIAAIKRAVAEDPTLKSQQIGVMLLPFESLDRNQQVFSDLNRTVQKTSRSLDILYDHDDPLNGIVKSVATRVPLFHDRVEKNATSLAVRSRQFVTLSSLYDACRQLLGGTAAVGALKDEDKATLAEELCVAYWRTLSDLINPWRMVRDGEMRPSEARIDYIVAHAVAFHALGASGAQVLSITGERDWGKNHNLEALTPLRDIDWRKTNPDWQGVAMLGHAVVTRHQTRQALARRISHLLDPKRFTDAPKVL